MEWTEDGVILATRRHGESSAILELFTEGRGRHLGLVRGGRSRRMQVVLQPGNGVTATWRARLDEHLGLYAVEPGFGRAGLLMESQQALYAFATLAAHVRLLPERDPHPALYRRFLEALPRLAEPLTGPAAIARFELHLLAELGFGLDLTQCAATGARQDLAFVSPKSGRAVSAAAGAPYADRLLVLPAFLRLDDESTAEARPVRDALALTGYFLARHVWQPRYLAEPPERQRVVAAVTRRADAGANGETRGD